jgi:hypothetical protein
VTSAALVALFVLATSQAWSLQLSDLLFTSITILGPFLLSGLSLVLAARLAHSATAEPAIVVLLLVIGLTMMGLAQLNPPVAEDASTPATTFSAARALTHVTASAQEPHPVGSGEHDRVRDYKAFFVASVE